MKTNLTREEFTALSCLYDAQQGRTPVFSEYYLNDTATAIYQVSADGESYLLQKGDTNWYPYEGAVPDHATQIARYAAERLEDTWAGEVNK